MEPRIGNGDEPENLQRPGGGSDGGALVGGGAPGGPLFMPGFISPLVNVRGFQGSCATLVWDLQAELNDLSIQLDDIDVSMDDLKIITDEQLVKKALEEVFKESTFPNTVNGPSECEPSDNNVGKVVVMASGTDTGLVSEESSTFKNTVNGTSELDAIDNDAGKATVMASATSEREPDDGIVGKGVMDSATDMGLVSRVLSSKHSISRPENSSLVEPRQDLGNDAYLQKEWEQDAGIQGGSNSPVLTKPPQIGGSFMELLNGGGNLDQTENEDGGGEMQSLAVADPHGLKITYGGRAHHHGFSPMLGSAIGSELVENTTPPNDQSKMGLELQNNEATTGGQKKRKRGKPFDRIVRAAELEMIGNSTKEECLSKLKREREAAKASCTLESLRAKREKEGVATCLGQLKSLKAFHFFTSALKMDTKALMQYEPVIPYEVVLCVEYYHGIRKQQKCQEFLVLGSQSLTALRDKLYCLTDELMEKAHMHVPSGYFLIEDVFYNDMRDARATNYSIPIINWVKEQDEAMEKWKAVGGVDFRRRQRVGLPSSLSPFDRLPNFQAADMATTQFLDLHCQLGVQYLYCHQGECKHAIVIRDMRLLHKEDAQNMLSYPLLRFQPRLRHRKCTICDIYSAKKVTYGDRLAPASPCFFCEHCYYLLHYSRQGTLLYDDFKVYDYYHE